MGGVRVCVCVCLGSAPQALSPTSLAVTVARYGPGMYEPMAAMSMTAPGPFSWAGLLAVLSQPRMQQVLWGWAVRMLPALLVSCAPLLLRRQEAAAAPAAAVGTADTGPSIKRAAAAARREGVADSGRQPDTGAGSSSPAAAAQQLLPAASAAPGTGAGPGLGPGDSVGAAVSIAAAIANQGDLIRMAWLHPKAAALKPGGWLMGSSRQPHAAS